MTEEQKAMIKADCDMANADSTASAAATDNTSTGTDSQCLTPAVRPRDQGVPEAAIPIMAARMLRPPQHPCS